MKSRRVLAVGAVFAAIGSFGVATVHAGDVPASITLEIDPTSGPVGTVISASGECIEDGGGECDSAILTLFDPDGVEVDSFTDEEPLPEYAGTLTVPPDGPCGEYTVLAEGEENEVIESFIEATFTVPCPETTTTTTEETSTTEGSVAATGATRPSFTG
jgi:hypothetical protein